MISHLTPERRTTVDWETIGPAKHRGKFKYWREVYKLWNIRSGATPRSIDDPDVDIWDDAAVEWEMAKYCSRRR